MLTDDDIQSLIVSGGLVRWHARLGVRPEVQRRAILMLPEVIAAVDAPRWPMGDGEKTSGPKNRRHAFHAMLAGFITGHAMVAQEHIKLLRPTNAYFRDLFEFRSRPPNPQVRLLGYFLRPAVFAGLEFVQRDELETQADWDAAAELVANRWTLIAPKLMPMRGIHPVKTKSELSKYIDEF